MIVRVWPLALLALMPTCVVFVNGPTDLFFALNVDGSWGVSPAFLSSTCGATENEPFGMSVVQNGESLQFDVQVQDFGPIRYDGSVEEDGDFLVDNVTVFASPALEDRSIVDGRFDAEGGTFSGTEIETITDLRTGDQCQIHRRWTGSRP